MDGHLPIFARWFICDFETGDQRRQHLLQTASAQSITDEFCKMPALDNAATH
jgi:hypothetical protein